MSNEALVIYCVRTTSRIEYIFSTLLSAIGITNYRFTNDISHFKNLSQPKLNYSQNRLAPGELFINSVDLLFENQLRQQVFDLFSFYETRAFCKTSGGNFPFDIFASSFYLLSRYEEYLPYKPDIYGRFGHTNALAYREGFLKVPAVNIWLQHFENVLLNKFPSLQHEPSAFRFLPTYDIDIAWSYRNKGLLRHAGGVIKSAFSRDWATIKERVSVVAGRQQDPFDSYNWLNKMHDEYNLKPVYFFLVAKRNRRYDKHILPSKHDLQQLIRQHADKYDVGIHPSWQSGDEGELVEEEIRLLKHLSGKEIYRSRQHYIRLKLPETYRKLIELGITEDYSMGYGSINGFRASYCLPYKWYDLQKEETTSLTIFPFCYMDANSYYEQQYSCEKAIEEMRHYYEVTKGVKGLLITVWHNHFLGTNKMFMGWREVYKQSIEKMNG